jgi:hypothetical protein
MDMDPILNVILLAAGGLLTVFCGWRGAGPPDLRRGPRLMPWRFLMLLGATFTLIMLAFLMHHFGLMPQPTLRY